MNETKVSYFLDVPHVRQSFSWDCGLACIRMALKHFNIEDAQIFDRICQQLKFNESVWTIDLALILDEFGLDMEMFTIMLGVNESYKEQSFYASHFSSDQLRVNNLFQLAAAKGIPTHQQSLSRQQIVKKLSTNPYLLIVLVNDHLLQCHWCKGCNFQFVSVVLQCLPNFNYQGHYVIVCGIDTDRNLVFYKNPGIADSVCCTDWDTFDRARLSYGTDEDLLFVRSAKAIE